MAKLTGPLFSLEAIGKLADTLYYHFNRAGNYVSRVVKKKYTRTEAQDTIRKWFKDAIDSFQDFSAEERTLWDLAVMNYKDYGVSLSKFVHRWARCLFLHHVLIDFSFTWRGSPFPPELWQMLAKDEIPGYDQLKSDLETLTGLVFCDPVDPYFFQYLGIIKSSGHPGFGQATAGLCNSRGSAIAIRKDFWDEWDTWVRDMKVAHELTHALMDQHGWDYNHNVLDSETIANECGTRVANGNLTPIYTYKGKTLSELVDNPGCS